MDEFSVWDPVSARAPEEVWERYFQTIAASARSGLYDIIAHPDLVKYWGDPAGRPPGDLRRYYEPAVEAFADSGVAVELSTAGLRKPAGELYPAPAFLEMCVQAGRPGRALQRRPPARRRGRRLRARARAARASWAWASLRASAAVFARWRRSAPDSPAGRRRLDAWSASAMTATGWRRGARWCSGAWRSSTSRGLEGHSDADVLAHAVTDALLGAAGMGDIGEHFPDTDERWRGADSIELLRASWRCWPSVSWGR